MVNTTQETVIVNGNCGIREAIQAANTDAAVDACTASAAGLDSITFNIPGGGTQIITLTSSLVVLSPVNIDATTQPGWSAGSPGMPVVVITGATSQLIDFQSGSGGSSIKGIQFVNTTSGSLSSAIRLQADSISVSGNFINTDSLGSLGGDQTIGVLLSGASLTTVGGASGAERNLFGGHAGVRVDDGSNNTIRNNYFGVAIGGSTALTSLAGDDEAINFCGYGCSASTGNVIRDNVITGFYDGILLDSLLRVQQRVGQHCGSGRGRHDELRAPPASS